MSMAKGLGHAGATIIVNGHTQEKMQSALASYEKEGIKAYGYLFDVTNEAVVEANVNKIEKEVGPIDVLINNAGIIMRVPILEMSADDFRKVVDVDLTGPFIVSKHVGKKMIE